MCEGTVHEAFLHEAFEAVGVDGGVPYVAVELSKVTIPH